VNPPGNPKAKFYHAEGGKPPAAADAWLKTAREHAGSWWPFWMQWLQARSGPQQPAPAALGNAAHPPGDAAPGRYVFN
jgi:polyhydroxyalkanoate synthase